MAGALLFVPVHGATAETSPTGPERTTVSQAQARAQGLSRPTGVRAKRLSKRQARVGWNQVPSATAYVVVFKPRGTTWADARSVSLGAPRVLLKGLKPGRAYRVRVSAVGGPGTTVGLAAR